ncbi:glycosyltransferase family 2 protein [Colwellia sp. C1TZA3]|uniref:glycosyltransferase family 2 protein n=1 Tax=Colwellia sp. C1TZA3 TaxID=2508879 RepID=UPI001748498A|nr:glycosyltransferase family A protein [Colwellia sp. C1TZA3]
MVPSISVVIPFYHAEEFFDETYQSIKQQTIQPQEIIVVNDGCGKKALTFLSQYNDIKIINFEKNKGVSAARNAGAKAANGEWIAFLDADDMWLPTKLEDQSQFINDNPHFSACHTGISTFNNNGIISTFLDKPSECKIPEILCEVQVLPSAFFVKKDVLLSVGLFDNKIRCSEDHELIIRMTLAGYRIGFLNKALTQLRRMDHGNLSSNGRNMLIGHYEVLTKHWKTFRIHKGYTNLYVYKTFMTAGGKCLGIERKLYFVVGRIFKLFLLKNLSTTQ